MIAPADAPPLADVRVLDLTIGAAAGAARLLADLGAEVRRIEPPGGSTDRREGRLAGGVSLDFVAANRGKSLTLLDLDRAHDGVRLEALAAQADIVIDSFAPGSPAGARFGGEAMHARHPTLVTMSITPFGHRGALARWQATDPVLHALSGELSRSGLPDEPPLIPPGRLATECALTQAGFGLLLAHIACRASGAGDWLDFALLDGAAQALDPGFGSNGSAAAGVRPADLPRGRVDARFQYPILSCADGAVRLCLLAPRQWRGMFEWLGRPPAFADPRFDGIVARYRSPDLLPAIARLFAQLTRAEIELAGQHYGVPVAGLRDPAEAVDTPQMIARAALTELALTPSLATRWPGSPIEIDGRRPDPGTVPQLCDPAGDAFPARPVAPAPPRAAGRLPLDGMRVLDMGVIVVGAETGRLLADAGADVVKIESAAFPDGLRQTRDGSAMSPSFAAGHRNKQSLALDLRRPEGKALFLQLIAQADVLLSNFKPGTLASLGFDPEMLAQTNPRLVAIDSSAFGPSGPWSGRLGYGPLVRAAAGITAVWGYPGRPDSYSDTTTVYPDHTAGRLGATAALALLLRRERTGAGGAASVSQAELVLSQNAAEIAARRLAEAGHHVEGSEPDAPWGVYRCKGDDEWCVITSRGDDDWLALAPLMGLAGDAALRSRSGRLGARDRIDTAVAGWLAGHDADAAMHRLQQAGVPAAAMLRVGDLPAFAHFAGRRFFRESHHPSLAAAFLTETRPAPSAMPDPPDRPAPLMGEHSAMVLRRWLGLPEDAIAALIAAGAVSAIDPPTFVETQP
ncbi:CoA transferase [Sphingomonas sp.]|uniref:CaiB/BaiF CoA-transferase family protein n=1 Tax=Sphingomonas sp. TaxID=28214 RepID=UPI003CC561AB